MGTDKKGLQEAIRLTTTIMRIIYLHQYFNTPDMVGGTRSYEMARRLVAAGHEVHMVTTWREPTDKKDWFTTVEAGIQVHWLPLLYSNYMSYGQRIKAFIRFAWSSARKAASLPGDIVFATSTPLTIALPGIFASRYKGIPMVFEVRDLWPDVPVSLGILKNKAMVKVAYILENWAYHSSIRIVALAPGMKEQIVNKGYPKNRVLVIPNGCDFDIFGGESATLNSDEPWCADQRPLIVYCGTMGVLNGVEYIVQVAYELNKIGKSPVKFLLIGDGKQRADIETLAKNLGIFNKDVFFAGLLPKREVAKWIKTSIATIMTYDGPEIVYRDSVSNKFFDSIAAGKAVLANFAGFCTQIAAEAGAGVILNREPKIAAMELLRLFRNGKFFEISGRAAKYLAEKSFNRDRLAQDLEKVFQESLVKNANTPVVTIKRTCDIVLAYLSLLLLWPAVFVIALLVFLQFGYPIFFTQIRPGLHGKPFTLYKFRTMTDDRDIKGNLLPDVERLTPLGCFLRSTSLDELPELFNALKGDMSLVGPRPLLLQYLECYTPEQARRHVVKPGITGWAQVNGRNAISWEDKFKLDVWYVDNCSLWLDLKIIAKTVIIVLKRKGISQEGEATMGEFKGANKKR